MLPAPCGRGLLVRHHGVINQPFNKGVCNGGIASALLPMLRKKEWRICSDNTLNVLRALLGVLLSSAKVPRGEKRSAGKTVVLPRRGAGAPGAFAEKILYPRFLGLLWRC